MIHTFFDDDETKAVSKLKGKTIVDIVIDGRMDSLTLNLNDGSRIIFYGVWHNDGTAGLGVDEDDT